MIKIAFLMNYPTSYKGGINYFRNLFFAINEHLSQKVETVLFVPDNLSQEYFDLFSPYIQIIRTSILRRNSPKWILDKLGEKIFNTNPLLDRLLLTHKVDVVSHSSFISQKVKTINWIMDFQHVHFSNLWTKQELAETRRFLHRLIIKSDRIFVSSHSAYRDFESEYRALSEKVNVLHFVSQPHGVLKVRLDEDEKKRLSQKYCIDRPFFYLPNQFWAHKNHEIVFKAIKILKHNGYDPLLITSGLMSDFRSKKDHVYNLKHFVKQNALEGNIKFLGLIPYKDVLDLITLSDCVINPSFFEGWSSTVEESKTMGKLLLLSDIKVHREQAPENGVYFDAHNVNELASIMEKVITGAMKPNYFSNAKLCENLLNRTEKFADDFLSGIEAVLKSNSHMNVSPHE